MGSATKAVQSGFDVIFAREEYKNDKRQAEIEAKEAITKAKNEAKLKEEKYKADLETKQNLLKKNLATQKAKFGSQMITSNSMSSKAVLGNIQDAALKEMQTDKELYELEQAKIADELDTSLSKSLLKKKRAKKTELQNYIKNGIKAGDSAANTIAGL